VGSPGGAAIAAGTSAATGRVTMTPNPSSRVLRVRPGSWLACFAIALTLSLVGCTSEPTGDDDDDISVAVDARPAEIDAAPESCGNARCGAGESRTTCPADCAVCGDTFCDGNEASTCASDCAICGNAICEGNEASTCSADCTARLLVRNNSSYTIYYLYLRTCSSSTWSGDQLGANVIVPGGTFTLSGIPPGCWFFRAEDAGAAHRWTSPTGTSLVGGQTYPWTLIN
jgi:hypothetical protein